MPKKPGAARARKQSSKPKARKSIELVHSRIPPGQAARQETDEIETRSLAPAVTFVPAGTFRKGALPHRQDRPLITAEEYAYVKRDLKTIGLLTVLMVTIIVILSVLLT
jgi:hypothetical protein